MKAPTFETWVRSSLAAGVVVRGGCSEAAGPEGFRFPEYASREYARVYGGGVRVAVHEALPWAEVAEPRVVLGIGTLSLWGCYALHVEVHAGENAILATVEEVYPHGLPCLGVPPSPAGFQSPILVPTGEKPLYLGQLGDTIEYRIRSSGAAIDLVRITPLNALQVLNGAVAFEKYTTSDLS